MNTAMNCAGLRLSNLLDAEGKKYRLLKEKSAIVQSTLRNITEHVTKNIREDVSKETLKIFNSLNWKKDYANLAIDSKYVIRVTREDGFDLAGSMSAGEKLFLALSFIMALKKITKLQIPVRHRQSAWQDCWRSEATFWHAHARTC